MQNLGNFTDTDVQADYTLYYGTIAEVKSHLTKAYGEINPKDFISGEGKGELDYMLERDAAKTAGLYHNTFLITQNLFTDNPLLLDGFSRCFVAYEFIKDQKVFIKDYTALTDSKAMTLMGIVNFWKTTESFTPLFDRGFTLYMFMKTGYNIKPHVSHNWGERVIGYFDAKQRLFYHYNGREITTDPKMIFNNEKVFDDLLTICKLYDLKSDDGYPYAVQFYMILNRFRVREPNKNFDFDSFAAWIKGDKKMNELALKLHKSYNVTSKETIMTEAVQLAWRKYILPVVFNEPEELTTAEKKKQFQKMATKEKKAYKMVSFEDLVDIPKNTTIYYINQDISNLKFEVTEETYLGFTIEEDIDRTFALSSLAKKNGRTLIETDYCFSFKNKNGVIDMKKITTKDWVFRQRERDYGGTMYIKK